MGLLDDDFLGPPGSYRVFKSVEEAREHLASHPRLARLLSFDELYEELAPPLKRRSFYNLLRKHGWPGREDCGPSLGIAYDEYVVRGFLRSCGYESS